MAARWKSEPVMEITLTEIYNSVQRVNTRVSRLEKALIATLAIVIGEVGIGSIIAMVGA